MDGEERRRLGRKPVKVVVLTLLLIGTLGLVFDLGLVRAGGTIYIKADGSVDPPSAPISSVDNITYTFTGSIGDEIVVERSNIVVDGNGYTLEGSGSGNGFYLSTANNVTIQNTNITNFYEGVRLSSLSNDNTVSGNTITNNTYGVLLSSSSNNTVSGNTITNNDYHGVYVYQSSNNTVSGNTITNNDYHGVYVYQSSNNTVSGNTITNCTSEGVYLLDSCNDNTVSGNTITNCTTGVYLRLSSNGNTVSGNTITNCTTGVYLRLSSNGNTVSGNTIITNNWAGIWLDQSSNNKFYHNNFMDNTQQVNIQTSGYSNFWDDGYPSGGNYWSDYADVDLYSGPHQNETGKDGIGDVPYTIDANNTDNYPLMRALYYESRMTQVVSTESAAESYEPSLAVDSSGNVHIAWHDLTRFVNGYDSGTDVDIFYKKFVPGSGWSTTEVVSTESTATSAYPSLAVDSSGNVHVAWYDYTRFVNGYDSGTDVDIFYKNRTSSWSTTEVVSTESTANSYLPSLAVDSSGNVHIVWHDYTRFVNGYDSGTDVDIFYKNRTSSWSTTEVVSTESTANSYLPSLAVDSNGNVHVAWADDTDYTGCGSDRDIFYKNRTSSWSTTEVVSTESTSDSSYPSLAVDLARNVHVAWADDTDYTGCGSDRDIFYKRYEVGLNWTSTEVVSTESTGESWRPSLAVDLARNVHVAWEDNTNYGGSSPDWDIFYKYLHLHFTVYPWSMFRHNPRHMGYTESPAPHTNQTQWTYPTGDFVVSSPAVADGMVFIGSHNGNVYALDQHTGARIWNYTTGDDVQSSPAVADGMVFIGSLDREVYALNEFTGDLEWNYTTGGAVVSSPVVADGIVYVGCLDSNVYALNEVTGELIRIYPTGGQIYSSPAVAEGTVFIGSRDGKVYAWNAGTGTLIWNYTTEEGVDSSAAVANGMVFIGSADHNVYALSASTGDLIWNYTTGHRVWRSSPAVVDGVVFVGSEDSNVYALNATAETLTPAQRLIWSYPTGNQLWSSPAVADGMVFIGSYDRHVYALNQSTGTLIWSYITGNSTWSSPAVADGMLFIGSKDGKVYAFGNVIRVPEDYPTIQEAIDEAEPWATIIIAPGTYNESLIIDKPLTIIGGKGSSTDFAGEGSGIAVTILPEASGTIVTNIIMTNWDQGIFIDNASECKIYNNAMDLMGDSGIVIDGDNASNNLVYSNTICSNNIAIDLAESSTGNIICANTISGNDVGINVLHSSGNTIYWNSFVNNTEHVNASNPSSNTWDNGYPSGGNYWSDYTGEDVKNGPNQDQLGSDGIGDTPYNITLNGSEQDNYPLMSPHEYWSNPALGDINKDAKVDYKDLLQLAAAYGSTPEKSNWNLNCDLNRDCKIEALDLFYLGKKYGATVP